MIRLDGIRTEDNAAPDRLARAFLCGVEYALSALVLFGEDGNCMDVRLFDTAYGGISLPLHREARSAWLLSGHPFDTGEPSPQDLEHAALLCDLLGAEYVRLYIAGQSLPCRRIHLP